MQRNKQSPGAPPLNASDGVTKRSEKTEKTQIITVLAMGAAADSSMGVMSAVPVD